MDINVEEVLKSLQSLEGVNGYIIFNNDGNLSPPYFPGIPLKRSEKTISLEKSIHMASLISDLWNVSKKYIQRELRNPDVNHYTLPSLERPRNHPNQNQALLRVYHNLMYWEWIGYEWLVGDFTMVCIQLCGYAIEEAKKAAQAQAQAEAEAEKAKKGEKNQES